MIDLTPDGQPYDEMAENGFLLAALDDTGLTAEYDFFNEHYFTQEYHKRIFKTLRAFCDQGINNPERTVVVDALVNEQGLEPREAELLIWHGLAVDEDKFPFVSYAHGHYFAKNLIKAYNKRQLLSLGKSLKTSLEGDDIGLSLGLLQERIDTIRKRTSQASTVRIKTAEEIMTGNWPAPKWLIPDILPQGLAILAGKPKTGKSWLCMQLAIAVGSGGKFMGIEVEKGKVLYIALEDSNARLQDRMLKQRWPRQNNVRVITHEEYSQLIGGIEKGGNHKLSDIIKTQNYDLVVLDTLTRATDGDQMKPQDMKNALDVLQATAVQENCCILVIDHMPKLSGSEYDVINDVFGSISKVGIADTIMGFYRDRDLPTAKFAGIGRDINEFAFALKFDKELWCWQKENNFHLVKHTDRRADILAYIVSIEDVSMGAISAELEINKGTVSKALKSLLEDGLIADQKQGKHIIYQSTVKGREVYAMWEFEGVNDDAE